MFGEAEMGPGEPDFQFIRKSAEKNGSLKSSKLGFFSFLPKFFDVLKKLSVALTIFICLDKIIQLWKSGSFH